MEEYKQIPGYENYGISRRGEVKNLKTGKILKNQKSHNSKYYACALCKNGIAKTLNIHKLMAITYLNHIPNGHIVVVDHINNDSSDNRLENLQLISPRYNAQKRMIRDLPVGVTLYHKRYRAQILINKKYHYLGTFNTPEEAHQAYLAAIPR